MPEKRKIYEVTRGYPENNTPESTFCLFKDIVKPNMSHSIQSITIYACDGISPSGVPLNPTIVKTCDFASIVADYTKYDTMEQKAKELQLHEEAETYYHCKKQYEHYLWNQILNDLGIETCSRFGSGRNIDVDVIASDLNILFEENTVVCYLNRIKTWKTIRLLRLLTYKS